MSDTPDTTAQHAVLADAFDRDLDPLAEFAPVFETADADPFGMFVTDVLDARDLVPKTREHYERTFRQWSEFMAGEGRHPACPNTEHVQRYIRHRLTEKGNQPQTVKDKLKRLNAAYEWWQDEPSFPHPTDFNPFGAARSKVSLEGDGPKEPPRLSVDELRGILDGVTNVRNQAIITAQLKLGLRSSELCNIKLADLSLGNSEAEQHFPDMGTNPGLDGRENVLYVPHDRERNKSTRPRVLPLDDETRRVLLRYLLVRPDAGEPWLFLGTNDHGQMHRGGVLEIWQDVFLPEFAETERYRAITPHFGRHRFTTWWTVEQDAPREQVKYMRGDATGGTSLDDRGAIDHYIHSYYEDIEDLYRENIYKLGV